MTEKTDKSSHQKSNKKAQNDSKMTKNQANTDDLKAQELALKDKILMAFLSYVVFEGWTDRAIEAAFEDAQTPFAHYKVLFPFGFQDILSHYGNWADRKMRVKLEAIPKDSLKIRDRIFKAVEARLAVLEPHKEAVRTVMAQLAHPFNISIALKILYRTVDEMWYWAGDVSTDYNFYTKRGLLAGVYTSTLVYWLNDTSPNSVESWAFLKRRIDSVMSLGKTIGSMKEFFKGSNICTFPERFFQKKT